MRPSWAARSALGLLLGLTFLLSLPGVSSQVVTDYDLRLDDFYPGISATNITGTSRSVVSSSNLTLSYDMETLDGGLMDDFSGNANDGTISGTTDVAGRFGQARRFNGTSDDIRPGNSTSLNITTEALTISAYFNVDTIALAAQNILSKSEPSPSFVENIIFAVVNDDFRFRLHTLPGPATTTLTHPNFIIPGFWYQVLGVYDGTEMRLYLNGTEVQNGALSGTLRHTSGAEFRVGSLDTIQFMDGRIDEVLLWDRAISEREILYVVRGEDTTTYPFRFDSESLVPPDVVNGTHWIRGLDMTLEANNFSSPDFPLSFFVNVSAWGADSISWDSFVNVTDTDIGFNFTMPTGTYPYWVNDSFQSNLTTIGGDISFNWTDWVDGEHLFELGFNISSTPITSATVGLAYLYEPTIAKTNVTWSLETGPPFLAIDPSSGIMAGVPLAPQVAVVTVRATASGGLFLEQTFALVILQVGVLTDAQTMIIWLFIIIMLVLFVVGPVFRMWFLWMLAGIDGILFGLFVFSALETFPLAIIIMGFGGFLMVGGILLTISQAVRGAIAGREV